MRRHFLRSLLALIPLVWLGSSGREVIGAANRDDTMPDQQAKDNDKTVADWALGDLESRQAKSDRAYLEFFANPTMSMGLYVLPAGTKDTQTPHEHDEVYVVTKGKAVLTVEGRDFPAREGSILFVKAKAAHHFHSIEEDLKVLVFFSKANRD